MALSGRKYSTKGWSLKFVNFMKRAGIMKKKYDPLYFSFLGGVIVLEIVKLGSRSKVYFKSLIRDLDLELVAIIAMSPPPPPPKKLF